MIQGKKTQPTAITLDGRMLRSMPENQLRAGYDGGKKKQGAYCGRYFGLLAGIGGVPANDQKRESVRQLAPKGHEATSEHVEIAFVSQGGTGERLMQAAAERSTAL